jgi:hypothetical protein
MAESDALTKNVQRCSCGSPLFLDWGLEVIAARDYPTPAGVAPHGKEFSSRWGVKICAMCDKAWGLWDGQLLELSAIISQEDIQAVLLRLHAAPLAAKATARDP